MKTILILSTLIILAFSCGKQGSEDETSSRSAYQYSYCGQIQGSGNNLQMNTGNQIYNLSYQGQNSNILNTLAQQANTGQNTCVYTNIQPQTSSTNTGYQGYSYSTIVVQSLSNGSANNGNYVTQVCGSIYQGNSYNAGNSYYIQSNNSSGNTAIVSYLIQANNNTVTSQLYQITNQARQGCVYSNQQAAQGQYGMVLYADQIVIQ